MRRTLLRTVALTVLVAVAAVCGVLSYRALAPRKQGPDAWAQAVAVARKADGTKAVLPALRIREQAAAMFDDLAGSGPPPVRSRARLIAGLLRVQNASAQPDPRQALALAVAELQGAVRLDRQNDDAAYDLELLLSRSVQSGRPIGDPRPEKKKTSRGKPGAATPGTGY